jgi:hypothetical protein
MQCGISGAAEAVRLWAAAGNFPPLRLSIYPWGGADETVHQEKT